jgi:GTP-binding protein
MTPVIALVGRPNVGKSTLFNRLTGSRDALVADEPGLTRDRQYGIARFDGQQFIVIDTGGLSGEDEGIDGLIQQQAMQAVEEAHVTFFVTDGRAGLTAADENIARQLRQTGKPVVLLVNKTEHQEKQAAVAEFHALGLGVPHGISASHGDGVRPLVENVLQDILPAEVEAAESSNAKGIRIAVAGRPNAGKSTLVNRLLGEERVVVFDAPGTTRDSIYIPFRRDEEDFTIIDTAGVRRRGKVSEKVEKFSVIKTLQAIEEANVVILLIDARVGVSDHDLHLIGYVIDAGRAIVVAVNKWDGMEKDQRQRVRDEIDRKLSFLDFANIHFISALHGTGVGELFDSVKTAYKSAIIQVPTPRLTRILEDAITEHSPPLAGGRRIKLRYAHQGGQNPPLFIIHGNQTDKVPAAYKRYLINKFRKVLAIKGTPIRIEFKSGKNPYQGKKNVLTKRQLDKKRRNIQRTRKWKK